MRIFSIATAFGLFFALFVSPANAQDSVKDLAAKASAELRLLTAFQALERMTSQMNHFLVYAIEAERWGVVAGAFWKLSIPLTATVPTPLSSEVRLRTYS